MTPYDRFGGFVGGAVGVEVRQDRRLPLSECPAEAGDFRDGAGRERRDHLGHEWPAVVRAGVVDVAELLVVLPAEGDFVVRVPGDEGSPWFVVNRDCVS
jgi:hypothetical protein